MQPSSLIFLVIIGIWAAYFVQYWVRRREHLATIRSVDAFSETMRVLERRAPLPSVEDGGRSPRTYAVSPARAVRPQVTVKRAEQHPATASVRVDGRADGRATAPAATATHAAHAAPTEVPRMQPNRATRGSVVLLGLVGTVVFGVLSAVGVLLWWSFLVPLAIGVGGFLWLRAGVQGEIKARRAARGRARRAATRSEQAPTRTAVAGAGGAASAVAEDRDETSESAADVETPAEVAPAVSARTFELAQEVASAWVPDEAPFDISAPTVTETEVVASTETEVVASQEPTVAEPAAAAEPAVATAEVDEDDIPLTWDPVPVPRPTYTMKARAAERPAPAPVVPPVAIEDDTAYDDDVPERWVAGG